MGIARLCCYFLYLYCIYLIGMPVKSMAFIHDVRGMRRWSTEKQCYQYVLAYGDFHSKHSLATDEQLAALEQVFRAVQPRSCRVIVEDLGSPNDKGHQGCGAFTITSRGGILGGLTRRCQRWSLPVTNVEFRYCRVASLGPVFNACRSVVSASFKSTCVLSIATLLDEVDQVIHEVATYDDGDRINRWYAAGVASVKEAFKALALKGYSSMTVARYLDTFKSPVEKNKIVQRLLTFDSELIDYKILHAIVRASDSNIILVVAGSSHTQFVCDMLRKMGYHYMIKRSSRAQKSNGKWNVQPLKINASEVTAMVV